MAEIILHHYPTSAFSERVRLALGLKGLTYGSVTIPAAMPKPAAIGARRCCRSAPTKNPRAGTINLHVPRAGFDVTEA